MKKLTIIFALCLVIAGPIQAELIDHTGASYAWAAYNNLSAGSVNSPHTTPANTTEYTWDGDFPGEVQSGLLVKYAGGASTGVTMAIGHNGTGQLFWEGGGQYTGGPGGTIFHDVMGDTYDDNMALHSLGSVQTITFSGLDPTKLYTFAGAATKAPSYFDGLSTIEIAGVDASTAGNILSGLMPTNFAAFNGTHTATKTFLTYAEDDLVLWKNIAPGADGTFSIVGTQVVFGNRGHSPAFDTIALAQQGFVPEPATMSLLAAGAVIALMRRRT
jgi:hypothetical protein